MVFGVDGLLLRANEVLVFSFFFFCCYGLLCILLVYFVFLVIYYIYSPKEKKKVPELDFGPDHWCGTSAFSISYPVLYELVVNKHETMAEIWNCPLGQDSWNFRFVRAFNDWELDVVLSLLRAVQLELITLAEESVLWKVVKSDRFTVREAYNLLQRAAFSSFPIKGIWGRF